MGLMPLPTTKTTLYGDNMTHYNKFLDTVRDRRVRERIQARLTSVRAGNFGDRKSVGDGVWELRLAFGPGYRIYYGEAGNTIVLILCGGDKSSQKRDIERAKNYWKEYKERNKR